MATADEGCVYIVVEEVEYRDDTSIPGIIAGGIVAFFVGCLFGFLMFKLCSSTKRCLGTKRAVAAETPKYSKPVKPFLTYENAFTNGAARIHSEKKLPIEQDDEDSIDNERKLVRLSDFLADVTWDGMILCLGKKHLVRLFDLEFCMWKERYVCLLLQYRCILNDLVAKNVITEAEHHDILGKEEKRHSSSLDQAKKVFENYEEQCMNFNGKSLLDLFGTLQDSYVDDMKTMSAEYCNSSNSFSYLVFRLVDQEEVASAYRELLLHQLDMVEGTFRKTQDELFESTRDIYKGIGLMIRELVTTMITESEMSRTLENKCKNSLDKLVKTGRISSRTKERVNDTLQFECRISKEEVQELFSDFGTDILAFYESNLLKHEKESEHALQAMLLAYENQTSSDGFVESYLTVCNERKQYEIAVTKEFFDTELSQFMANSSKLSQSQLEKREIAINKFCLILEEIDALSHEELQRLNQEFRKQMTVSHAKASSTCKRNITELWKLYENHITKLLQEENRVDASILQDSVTDNLISLEGLLHLQINLSEFDLQAIMQERESINLLIINQINIFRAKWLHAVENDLAKSQAFLLIKKSEELVSDTVAELRGILERLWDERNSMKNYSREIASVSSIRSSMSSSQDKLCKVVSRKLVKNLVNELIVLQGDEMVFEDVESSLVKTISVKITLSNLGALTKDHNEKLEGALKELLDRHSISLTMAEEKIRASQSKRQGRLSTKAQKIAQHRPPSGPSPRDMQPHLDQILLQIQVARALENIESESIHQNLLERLILGKDVISNLSDVSRSSATSLLAKFSVLAGLTKTEYTSCISRVRKLHQENGHKGSTQKFLKFWKDAVVYVENHSY